MEKKQNPETTDKQAAPEVKDEALDQVNGGYYDGILQLLNHAKLGKVEKVMATPR